MINELQKDELRGCLRAYVESITEKDSRTGGRMYKCPICGSGKEAGNTHDGAFDISKDGKEWYCFSCKNGGDIFTLIGLYENIEDFNEQIKRATEFSNSIYVNEANEVNEVNGVNKVNEANEVNGVNKETVEKHKRYIYIKYLINIL